MIILNKINKIKNKIELKKKKKQSDHLALNFVIVQIQFFQACSSSYIW